MWLLACACATPYQHRTFSEAGYEELALHNGDWWVEVDGNQYTSQETLLEYFLARAAELCGHENFTFSRKYERIVVESDDGSQYTKFMVSGTVKCKGS